MFAAMRAGARGYLVKGADQGEVLRAIRAVASGEAIFGQAIAKRLIHFFSGRRDAAAVKAFPDLTDREREILVLIAEGRSNTQIAQRLLLGEKTITSPISSASSRLPTVVRRLFAPVKPASAGMASGTGVEANRRIKFSSIAAAGRVRVDALISANTGRAAFINKRRSGWHTRARRR